MVVSPKQDLTENLKVLTLLALNMELPVITVVTMLDLCSKTELEEFIKNYKTNLKNLKIYKVPLIVSNVDDLILFSRNLEENIHPIFLLSNKTGLGIEFIINFMNLLHVKKNLVSSDSAEFDIQEHFIANKKLIVGGIVTSGKIVVGEKYYLGPDKNGNFK
jgi:elongation factor 1-alpha